ncbi:MAG: hypothetical protein J0L96_03730 [Anaerolineae bacterium]|nr:hypothetical protein [Anaerolineae bacterium]
MAKNKEESQVTFSDEQIKHLEFIQDAITRMNSNSFQMKSWMLILVTALLGSFANTGNKNFVLLALLPTLIFWGLDTYYLQLERKFRGVYNDVTGLAKEPKEIKLFAMPINLYEGGKYSFGDVFLSVTILPLYLLVIGILLLIFFIV